MSHLLVLPTPLLSSSFTLGQLITDPHDANSASLKPTKLPAYKESAVQSDPEDFDSQDGSGSIGTLSLVTMNKPTTVFNSLRTEDTARNFLRKMSSLSKPAYFVTGVQTVQDSVLKRTVVAEHLVAEAKAPQSRLPVRRVDSANSLDDSSKERTGSITAIELLKIKCIVGPSSAPHTLEDLEYDWSYHSLDDEEEDLQLSIGLGRYVEAADMQPLADIADEEEYRGRSWVSYYSDSEDGIGGF